MNALKRSLFTLALIAGVSSSALLAQPPEGGPPPGEHGERKGPGGPGGQRGDRLKQLAEELGLTEEQKAVLKPILTEEAAALKAIREDKSLEREAKWEKAKAVMESYAPKIAAHLTPEQKEKWEKIKVQRGPGGPGGPRGERGEKK